MEDQEERRKQAEQAAEGDSAHWKLDRIMLRRPLAVAENATVLEVCETMAESRLGQVLVVDKEWRPRAKLDLPPEPIGIFTERDLIRAFATHRDKVLGMSVGEVMTSPVVCLAPDEDIQRAAELMLLMQIRRIPVVEKGKTVGLLTRGRVMESQARRLEAIQKENAVLEERVVHDALTGLANRTLFEDVLDRETARAKERGGAVSMLMLDIDFFKKVNDTYGHPVGDTVLRQLARVFRENLRRADLPARLGGEEFGVVLVQAQADPMSVAEKVRKAVEQDLFGEPSDPFHVTISIGAAIWDPSMDKATLIKKADEALYEAKRGGRNRVVLSK